jgi:hypothetical protein
MKNWTQKTPNKLGWYWFYSRPIGRKPTLGFIDFRVTHFLVDGVEYKISDMRGYWVKAEPQF